MHHHRRYLLILPNRPITISFRWLSGCSPIFVCPFLQQVGTKHWLRNSGYVCSSSERHVHMSGRSGLCNCISDYGPPCSSSAKQVFFTASVLWGKISSITDTDVSWMARRCNRPTPPVLKRAYLLVSSTGLWNTIILTNHCLTDVRSFIHRKSGLHLILPGVW